MNHIMEWYISIIAVVTAAGIGSNIVFNAVSAEKDNSGIIIMAASGACAFLLMLFSLNFKSFAAYTLFIIVAAASMITAYLLMAAIRKRKERFKKVNTGTSSAWELRPKIRETRETQSIPAGSAARRIYPKETEKKVSPVMEDDREKESVKKSDEMTEHRTAVLKNAEPANKVKEDKQSFEPLPDFKEAVETNADAGEKTPDDLTAYNDIKIEADTTLFLEEETAVEDTKEEQVFSKDDLTAHNDINPESDTTLFLEEETAVEDTEEEAQGFSEDDLTAHNDIKIEADTARLLEEETAVEGTNEDCGVQDFTGEILENVTDEPEVSNDPLGGKTVLDEEDESETRQKEILEKAAMFKSQGKYLIAYQLFETCVRQMAELKTAKSAEFEMLDCLVLAGQYEDAGKQLFSLLNKNYGLEPKEKEKIRGYMEALNNADRQR